MANDVSHRNAVDLEQRNAVSRCEELAIVQCQLPLGVTVNRSAIASERHQAIKQPLSLEYRRADENINASLSGKICDRLRWPGQTEPVFK